MDVASELLDMGDKGNISVVADRSGEESEMVDNTRVPSKQGTNETRIFRDIVVNLLAAKLTHVRLPFTDKLPATLCTWRDWWRT